MTHQTCMYFNITYEQYKEVEEQMRKFSETSHHSEGGFYHKSIRIRIPDAVTIEIHGPLVKADEGQYRT